MSVDLNLSAAAAACAARVLHWPAGHIVMSLLKVALMCLSASYLEAFGKVGSRMDGFPQCSVNLPAMYGPISLWHMDPDCGQDASEHSSTCSKKMQPKSTGCACALFALLASDLRATCSDRTSILLKSGE